MLNSFGYFDGDVIMLLDPTDRFLLKKGKLEMARKLIDDGHPIDYVVELSGLSEKEILNAK